MEGKLNCKVQLSGFNCNFENDENSETSERLLSEPWYTLHKEQIERMIFIELKQKYGSEIKSVEFVCEVNTILQHIRKEMGGHWSSAKWKEAFEKHDASKNGSLDRTEFKRLIGQFKCTITEQEFRNLWNLVDKEQNGDISFFELVEAFQFDDWKEDQQKDSKMNKMVEDFWEKQNLQGGGSAKVVSSQNLLSRPSSVASQIRKIKDWAHVLVTFVSAAGAEKAVRDLHGKTIKLHDEVGTVLSDKHCQVSGIIPIHRSFTYADGKEVALKWTARVFLGNRRPDLLTSFSHTNARTAFGKSKMVCDHDQKLVNELVSIGQVVSLNRDIKALPAGQWQRAQQMIDEMLAKVVPYNRVGAGIKPWTSSFVVLIDAYLSSQPPQVRRAEMVLDDMKKNGVLPSAESIAAVVRGYGQIGCIERAERIVREMEKNGPNPNQDVYSALVAAYASHPSKKASQYLINASKVKARHIAGSKRYAALHRALYEFLGPAVPFELLQEQFQTFAGASGVLDQDKFAELLSAAKIIDAKRLVKDNWDEIDSAGRGEINFGQFLHSKEVLLRRTKDLAEGKYEEPTQDSLVAKFAKRCSGWVPTFFWRLDSIRTAA